MAYDRLVVGPYGSASAIGASRRSRLLGGRLYARPERSVQRFCLLEHLYIYTLYMYQFRSVRGGPPPYGW